MSVLSLEPVYQERIWGGSSFKELFGRDLPPGKLIGESWELCDRPEAQSRVTGSRTLHELWDSPDRMKIFGTASPDSERFPILIKLLDARDKLSLQVHPPASLASKFNGEPKTEMWYFLETAPGAEIYAGLKRGVDRAAFEHALSSKTVADCFHRLKTAPGETMFLPSGRVHAIGAGNVILEIQQNSDTTFRVYDWDRVDAKTGRERELHVRESLECIHFNDFEPCFAQPHGNRLVSCTYFSVFRNFFDAAGQTEDLCIDGSSFCFIFVSSGKFRVGDREYPRGSSLLVTAEPATLEMECLGESGELISVTWP